MSKPTIVNITIDTKTSVEQDLKAVEDLKKHKEESLKLQIDKINLAMEDLQLQKELLNAELQGNPLPLLNFELRQIAISLLKIKKELEECQFIDSQNNDDHWINKLGVPDKMRGMQFRLDYDKYTLAMLIKKTNQEKLPSEVSSIIEILQQHIQEIEKTVTTYNSSPFDKCTIL